MRMHTIFVSTMLGLSIATAFPVSLGAAEDPGQTRASGRAAAAPALLENAKALQSHAARIAKAKSAAERDELLQEHYRLMREGMMLTFGMMSTGGRGPWGGMMGGYGMMGGHGMMGMMGMMPDGWSYQGMMPWAGMMRGPMMMDGPWGWGAMDLSEDQAKRINAIHDATRRQRWELMGKLMDEQVKLRELYGADKRDAGAIGAQYQRMFDLQRQMMEAGVAAQNQVEEALTPEQRKALRDGWRRGMMGGGMMGGPGMMGR